MWIGRELWHILNNIQSYVQQPELLVMNTASEKFISTQSATRQEMIQALQDWESTWAETSSIHLNLFWIGDKPSESFLPN